MPIYEYRCERCGHELEKLQKLAEDPLTECPACGEPTLKKLISAAGFRLKGGGWYETDFKTGGKKNLHGDGEKAGGGEKSDGGEKSGGGAEKKTETAKPAETAAKPAEKKPAAKPDAA
ncbi:zinc ribbon domain-containing protein [uncultured Thiodictyon sp.]|jgi:putative FmdB family regulatory protein|uniref:FmdB family zinc ribbon protein n=1 Tax=uncultured Thiodictyon sp. TaxID=1846217 RepID=UPI0025FA65B3|nr:zinc ribbon domain-containing protein [uncultured Thiodictyon sp.]